MSEAVGVIAAHPDDEVLGCGGTLARLATEGRAVHLLIIADGESSRSLVEAGQLAERKAATERACEILGCASVEMLNLPDNRLDEFPLLEIVKRVETFLEVNRPSVVMTHHCGDVNIDHRIVHDAVIAACRPQPHMCVNELLFFEVPSATEWRPPRSAEAFAPNWYVDITSTLTVKLEAMRAYHRELRAFPHPRSLLAVESLARWRGATVGVHAAEAFFVGRKIIR